jgi:dCMP deaminase
MLSRREEAYLSIARYLAKKSQSRQKHGAIVVRGGSVLGMGYNKDRNHPSRVSPEHIKTHCSRHAELEAIRDAKWNVKGAVLYVARVNSRDEDRNSKPCMLCEKIIIETEIKKVIYTRSSNGN